MLLVVGQLMKDASWLIKGLAFDGHHSHGYLREALTGWFVRLKEGDLQGLPFWADVRYKDLPPHAMPRLPLRLCFHSGESIWALGGPCSLLGEQSSFLLQYATCFRFFASV